jgi:hypothetical protein
VGDKKRIHHSGKRNLGRCSLGTAIWICKFNIKISTFFKDKFNSSVDFKHTLDAFFLALKKDAITQIIEQMVLFVIRPRRIIRSNMLKEK